MVSVTSTKFDFNLNDDVYIRPKSVKELGISGRIVALSYDTTKKEKRVEITPGPCQRSKKRTLIEDVRVSVQQHCHNKNNLISHCGRVKTCVRPSRLFPVYDICKDEDIRPLSLILLTADTTNYRQLASSHVRAYDKVLEIGCSTGECTALVMRRLVLLHSNPCRKRQEDGVREEEDNSRSRPRVRIVAFDIGSDMIEQAKHRLFAELDHLFPIGKADARNSSDTAEKFYRMVHFHRVDAIADPKGAHTYATTDDERRPDIVLIDIGGNRELKAVVQMIRWVQSTFGNEPPRLVIVKSEALVDELSISATRSKGKEGEYEGESAEELVEDRSVSGISTVRPVVLENGVIEHAQEWFSSLIPSSVEGSDDAKCSSSDKHSMMPEQSAPKYSHPMKAPLVLSPKDNITPICRWHNYDPAGCKRFISSRCPYDHDHCHWCQDVGHVALNCSK
ncbi:hypothetical protein ACHAW5_004360 [Stephanodiscus triporus]|uniref:C3H1-type domain-containing protein n=1 Tax=Stephanodiscus triporus TaxID=2934178 RepID=A0ABD3Q3N6_9STRA